MPEAYGDRALAALARHAPARAVQPLLPLGAGLDHHAFRSGDLVLRVTAGGPVAGEARLLRALAGRLAVPIPGVVFADDELGVLAHPWLPGTPLLGRTTPPGLAVVLGRFLGRLHGLDVADLEFLAVDPADPADRLAELAGREELLETLRADVPEPSETRVPAHADLGAEHLLEADGALTGVIDWTDAAVTDPALDVARLLRDFGPRFVADLRDAYDRPVDAGFDRRVLFFARCAALEDLAYGLEAGRPAYADAARASLRWLFPAASEPGMDEAAVDERPRGPALWTTKRAPGGSVPT